MREFPNAFHDTRFAERLAMHDPYLIGERSYGCEISESEPSDANGHFPSASAASAVRLGGPAGCSRSDDLLHSMVGIIGRLWSSVRRSEAAR